MKRKFLYIFAGVIILSLVGVGIAYAFSVGNVDGVWSQIDVGGDTEPDVHAGLLADRPHRCG